MSHRSLSYLVPLLEFNPIGNEAEHGFALDDVDFRRAILKRRMKKILHFSGQRLFRVSGSDSHAQDCESWLSFNGIEFHGEFPAILFRCVPKQTFPGIPFCQRRLEICI